MAAGRRGGGGAGLLLAPSALISSLVWGWCRAANRRRTSAWYRPSPRPDSCALGCARGLKVPPWLRRTITPHVYCSNCKLRLAWRTLCLP